MTPSTRIRQGPAGEYHCERPWRTFHPSPAARKMLGLGEASTLDLTEINAAQPHDGAVRYDLVLAEIIRTGHPLVITHAQHRRSDGMLRVLVTVTEVRHDNHGEPARLQGHVVDITDDVCHGADLDTRSFVEVVECGPTLVVLLSGELDVSTRGELSYAMDAVLDHGNGPVYLDARHLQFCDARSMVILAESAVQLRSKQRHVVLFHPPPILRRLLPLIGFGEEGAMDIRTVPGVTRLA